MENLKKAFEGIANAREALDAIIAEPGFHNQTWEQAFSAAFDNLETLKTASAKDAATLGRVYCELVYTLINKLIDQTENKISLDQLCRMCYPAALDAAIHAFEDVIDQLFLQEMAIALAEEACNARA